MTELDNSCIYLDAERVSEYLVEEWEALVINIENVLKSYSAGKIIQPVRRSVSVQKHDGYLILHY